MKKILRYILIITSLNYSTTLYGQNEQGWEECYDEIHSIDGQENTNTEADYDVLSELASHPININTATREDLESIPFLSSQQVESIMEYMYKYHSMQSLGELHMITNLDDIYARL
ncbi:MAG: helix-hairpin-helix domain-containing protein, partial [Prevotella sp.]|nr:helix-hairpin-helix domain-containing protein [Prevotella sp.]